jgi:hypothetical protein
MVFYFRIHERFRSSKPYFSKRKEFLQDSPIHFSFANGALRWKLVLKVLQVETANKAHVDVALWAVSAAAADGSVACVAGAAEV